MSAINLKEKLSLFNDQWTPKIIGELNGQHVKLAKLQGEFVWHDHINEDELFYVIKGQLIIELRDNTITLNEGDLYIVPRGVEHKPIAHEEVHIMLFEPAVIKHTGDVQHEITKEKLDWI
ncbi:mannose-6-phosphate isomerase-like protein (cupin superfamily) [Nonlabens xylanidelens]|uniref:Mannose-6-phosphate isomerase-like protein (Cupin superfamily) n=1 Tax=Nonlabens xylanidelens TaxID=191564 RepID=A0A2S6ISK9_9FLAO|nr:cupin domain-containing protein [Nonlabens xylanidelens]PPK97151.1 mannose-6-phosphate isomerase-like protein (cupin superfamily) [Nonlabens xylanidelens]PQJ13829.1 mannose-6-phosphate isomerase [Nonlabens xylanidelens]